jgi:hypothetical protein
LPILPLIFTLAARQLFAGFRRFAAATLSRRQPRHAIFATLMPISLRFRHDFRHCRHCRHYCRLAAFADASQRCWLLRFRRFDTSLIIFADMIIS